MAEDATKKNGASENLISSGGERLYSLAIAAANVDLRPGSSQRTSTELLQNSQVKTFNVKGKGVERHLPNIGWHQQPMASKFENRLESSLSPTALSAACVDGFYPTPNPGCAYYEFFDFNPQAYLRPSAGIKSFSRNSTKQYFTQQNGHDTDIEICEPEESNSGNDPIFIVITRTKELKSGCTSTSWRFVDGTDTSYAVVGNPEPSKFYFTCESVDNSANIEAYQYNGIANFKWDNPHHINQLNRARSGLQSRIFGGFADKSFPLTVMEKEALKEEVREAVNAGFNKHTMDWNWIAKSLKNRFKDVIQPKGVRLALGPDRGELHNGDRGERLSPSARIGYSRTADQTAAQASNYQDILEMMNGTVGRGSYSATHVHQWM
ncbi:hypothetical protein ACMFMG_008542 [Clarireedia jacksonii]